MKNRKPSKIQAEILQRMAEGWVLCEFLNSAGPTNFVSWGAYNDPPINSGIFKSMLKNEWIYLFEEIMDVGRYTITAAGRVALAKIQLINRGFDITAEDNSPAVLYLSKFCSYINMENMISNKEIQRLANLARLKLNQEEIKKYQKDLSSILDYFKRLERIKTEDVNLNEPLSTLKNVLAEDKVCEADSKIKENLLKQAPIRKGKFIKTKGVLTKILNPKS